MDRFGEFESAAHVFTSLLDHIWEPRSRLMLVASLARAAAGAGWREMFESMWIECWAMIRHQPNSDGHASALAQLALGASNVGSWARAQFAAEEAFSLAKQRGEGEVLFVVESILEAVRHGVIAEDSLNGITAPQRTGGRLPNEEVANLATDIAAAMKVRRDDAPQSPARTPIPMS